VEVQGVTAAGTPHLDVGFQDKSSFVRAVIEDPVGDVEVGVGWSWVLYDDLVDTKDRRVILAGSRTAPSADGLLQTHECLIG
jgi:hypothetical protein